MVTYRLRRYLAHIRFAALSVAEKLVEIKRQDECKYDAMVIFNSKSDYDTNWVKQLMIELAGGDYPNINLERPDERVSYFLMVNIELAFCFDNVNFALYWWTYAWKFSYIFLTGKCSLNSLWQFYCTVGE